MSDKLYAISGAEIEQIYMFARNGATAKATALKRKLLQSPPLVSSAPAVIGMRDAIYKDSTPKLHVGSSSFEDWFQAQPFATQVGVKQMCRDSYAAGMGDPLVTYAPGGSQ